MKKTIIKKLLEKALDNISNDENLDEARLERFDRTIAWARNKGYETRLYEKISQCCHEILSNERYTIKSPNIYYSVEDEEIEWLRRFRMEDNI